MIELITSSNLIKKHTDFLHVQSTIQNFVSSFKLISLEYMKQAKYLIRPHKHAPYKKKHLISTAYYKFRFWFLLHFWSVLLLDILHFLQLKESKGT